MSHSRDLLEPRASRPQGSSKGSHHIGKTLFALRAHCGRDARGPSKSLDAHCHG